MSKAILAGVLFLVWVGLIVGIVALADGWREPMVWVLSVGTVCIGLWLAGIVAYWCYGAAEAIVDWWRERKEVSP